MKKLLSITAILSMLCTSAHGMSRFTRMLRPAIAAAAVMGTAKVVHAEETAQEKAIAQARAAFDESIGDKPVEKSNYTHDYGYLSFNAKITFRWCVGNAILSGATKYVSHPDCYRLVGENLREVLHQQFPQPTFWKNHALNREKDRLFKELQQQECDFLFRKACTAVITGLSSPYGEETVTKADVAKDLLEQFNRTKETRSPADFYILGLLAGKSKELEKKPNAAYFHELLKAACEEYFLPIWQS